MSDSCKHYYVGGALEKTKKVSCQVLEAPTSLVPFCPNLSSQLPPMALPNSHIRFSQIVFYFRGWWIHPDHLVLSTDTS